MELFYVEQRGNYRQNWNSKTQRRLSAKALSELAGLNKGYINRLENGRDFLPSLDALLNIIDACGISEEEFFYHDMKSYKEDMELISSMKNLSNDKKLAIATLLK